MKSDSRTSEREDATTGPILALSNVVRRYETGGETVVALDHVSFDARSGGFVSVMGPSGSGKSTMLNLLGLLDTPDEGQVLLDGRDVTGLDDEARTAERKRSIGFVFQSFFLLPTLTAVENVELPTLFGTDPTRRERAVDLLERVGLGDRLDHRPAELSGGQKQRVAIARALVNEPRLVLADEPTGNLDRETGATILDEFRRIADEQNVAVVAVTHDPQLSDYVDRTVELVDGQVR
jgi:putative ABC transport system ATP-binding protein